MFLFLGTTPGFVQTLDQQSTARPNIVFIMSDDHAQRALSAYHNELINTPNIDRIADEGALFSNSFVTNAICAPSRAVMLTGKYSHKNGLKDNLDQFNTDQVIFPKLLRKVGYETAMVGKWHLKKQPKGFDFWSILPEQGHYYNPDFLTMGDTVNYGGYVTDVITDIAIDFLNNRDASKPFCLLYHHKAPHRNWMPDIKHLEGHSPKNYPIPKSFFDRYKSRSSSVKNQDMRIEDMFLSMDMKLFQEYYDQENGSGGHVGHNAELDWANQFNRLSPEQKETWNQYYRPVNENFKKQKLKGKALAKWKYQRYMDDYLQCVTSLDENVGRLLNYLDEHRLMDNTLVIYTSDQGFYLGEHGWYDKRFMYEPSLNTPLLMRYPGHIEPGTVVTDLVMNVDYAPTILDYANLSIPLDMQGMSLRKILDGQAMQWRNSIYYHYYQSQGWHGVAKHCGIRTDRFKLIYYYELEEWELYDLVNDPNEVKNLYEKRKYQNTVVDMKLELEKLQEYYQDELF